VKEKFHFTLCHLDTLEILGATRFKKQKKKNFVAKIPYAKQGVCHNVALPFTLKSILMQKKNYGNSNISLAKIYNLQKVL
jgi:hypothetical protein